MNELAQYGLVAEIVAAIAVVVSLLFLAFQVREQSSQLARQVGQDRLATFSEVRRAVFSDSYPGEILDKAVTTPDQLSVGERFVLDNLFSEIIFAAYYYHSDISAGRINSGAWPLTMDWVNKALSNQYGMSWWSAHKNNFAPDFAQEIDRALNEV